MVLPHTIDIMREIQTRCKNVAPLDIIGARGVVLQNEFVLCLWEFVNSLYQSEKVEVIHSCKPRNTRGLVSIFEQTLIESLADGREGDFLLFHCRSGSFRIRAGACPVEFELRLDAMCLSEEDYAAWRMYLCDFHWAIQQIPCFKKSKPQLDN